MRAIALHETDEAKDLLTTLYHTPIPEEEAENIKQRITEIFLLAIAQGEASIVNLLLDQFRSYISLEDGLVIAARTGR
jgi:hypothetical protein